MRLITGGQAAFLGCSSQGLSFEAHYTFTPQTLILLHHCAHTRQSAQKCIFPRIIFHDFSRLTDSGIYLTLTSLSFWKPVCFSLLVCLHLETFAQGSHCPEQHFPSRCSTVLPSFVGLSTVRYRHAFATVRSASASRQQRPSATCLEDRVYRRLVQLGEES